MNRHLSPEQISEWILGKQTPEEEQHVRECRECSAELTRCRSALASFGQSVRNWAEHQKASAPPAETWASARLHAGPWHPAVAVAAALVIATGVPIYNGIRQAERQARQEQEDSQLLEQVHAQLSRMAPASLEPLLELMQEEGKETSQ